MTRGKDKIDFDHLGIFFFCLSGFQILPLATAGVYRSAIPLTALKVCEWPPKD